MRNLRANPFAAILAACLFLPFSNAWADYQILGWSPDGKLWAFVEEGDFGQGALVDERLSINIIEAKTNRFHKRHQLHVHEEKDEDFEAKRKEQKDFRREKLSLLREQGFSTKTGSVVFEAKPSDTKSYNNVIQYGTKQIAFDLPGGRYEIRLEDKFVQREEKEKISAYAAAASDWITPIQSGFTLSCRKDDGPWKTLQTDKKLWRKLQTYRIIFASINPEKTEIAVLIEGKESGFEGHQTLFHLGVTGTLP